MSSMYEHCRSQLWTPFTVDGILTALHSDVILSELIGE